MSKSKHPEWISIVVNIIMVFISIVFGITSCHYSKKAEQSAQIANNAAMTQASAALLEHQPYLAIVSHMDNGNKQHGIYVHNYSSGLAIIDSITISGEKNPKLTKEKWHDILKLNNFSDIEIQCFSFTMPEKDIGLGGNETVPLIFVSSIIEEQNSTSTKFSQVTDFCINSNLQRKLEKIDIQISYKSRFPNSTIENAKIFKLYE